MIFFHIMKSLPRLLLVPVFSMASIALLAGCTTIQNRRDLYFPGKVEGPYTRMLHYRLSAPKETHAPSSKESSDGKKVIKPQA